MNEERPMFLLGPIAAVLRWLEELANLLSGPLLVAGLGIALIDLLTDGALLTTAPILLYAWAVSQAIGVDAQLIGAWDRAKRAALHRRWWALTGLIALGLVLAYVAFIAGWVFATQEANHLSESQALARLGMNATSWLWQRVGVSVFLVCLSGWTRYRPPSAKATIADEREKLQRELELEPLRQRLRHTRLAGVRDAASALLRSPDLPDASDTPDPSIPITPAHAMRPSVAPVAAMQVGAGVGDPRGDATLLGVTPGAAGEAVVLSGASTDGAPDDEEPPPEPTPPPAPTRPTRRGKAAAGKVASNGHTPGSNTLTLLPLRTEHTDDREDFPPASRSDVQRRRRLASLSARSSSQSEKRKTSRSPSQSAKNERRRALEVAAFALLDADPSMTKVALRRALKVRQTTADSLHAAWYYGRQRTRANAATHQ